MSSGVEALFVLFFALNEHHFYMKFGGWDLSVG